MSLKERLKQDMVSATKSRDLVALSTLRLLLASVKNREIELREEAEDGEIVKIIATNIKQRKESIELYEKGGRQDLVEKEKKEIDVLETYLPPKMDRDEIIALIKDVIKDLEARGMQDLGRVMKDIMPRVAGRAEGKEVSDLVRDLLSK
ncbi:MAG: GatB/YqeY domain-containing protein [Deltaproteobacteria bacterium]|nr:GatB/YqeY domain-containing protein [Deltaproteobacteria bacterium]NIS78532.1 GatB/YqeY domain-containing protein [Deltaproteobacteria bacterium]